MELKLPLEFERLPEFWQFTEELRTLRASKPLQYPEDHCRLDELAQLLWLQRRVVLGYLARTTNQPGWHDAATLKAILARLAALIHIENECWPEKRRDSVRRRPLALAGVLGSKLASKTPEPLKSQSFRFIYVHDVGALTIYRLPGATPFSQTPETRRNSVPTL